MMPENNGYEYLWKPSFVATEVNHVLRRHDFDGGKINRYRQLNVIPDFLYAPRNLTKKGYLYAREAVDWVALGATLNGLGLSEEQIGRLFLAASQQWGKNQQTLERLKAVYEELRDHWDSSLFMTRIGLSI